MLCANNFDLQVTYAEHFLFKGLELFDRLQYLYSDIPYFYLLSWQKRFEKPITDGSY